MIECMRTDAKKPEPEEWILKEYLFRWERRDDREWVEGFLFVVNDVPYILPHHNTGQPIHADNLLKTAVEVLKDTVCQCTGQYDKNGKLIWENDICDRKEQYPEIVKYRDGDWTLDYSYAIHKESGVCYCNLGFYTEERKCAEVIGNIFDNPELLEV